MLLVGLLTAGCRAAPTAQPHPTPARTPLAARAGTDDAPLPAVRASAILGGHQYNQHCTACHGQQGIGDGVAGRALKPAPTNFRDAQYMRDQTPAWYYEAVARGVTGSAMARWDHLLDEAGLWDTAFYVWSMAAKPAALDRGVAIYRERCVVCHGATGAGVAKARLDDPIRVRLSRATAVEAMRARHADLAGVLSAPDLEAVVEFTWTFLYQPVRPLPALVQSGNAIGKATGDPPLPEGEVCPSD